MTTTTTKETGISFDFKNVKSELRQYLENQDVFNDYNFEASNLSILIDVLAYNTQMNAMTAHLALNELYLESAQARPNIVLLAKQLGYVPTSVTGAESVLDLKISNTVVTSGLFSNNTFTLPIGTEFSGGDFIWYTTETMTATRGADGSFFFANVRIKEGKRKSFRYVYSSKNPYRKFSIPDLDVDISSLRVSVWDNPNSSISKSFQKFETFSQIDDASARIYFLYEAPSGRYDVSFPSINDLGETPINGSIIELDYLYSNGRKANGVRTFSPVTSFPLHTIQILSSVSSFGGSNKESAESIRTNAPKFFKTQNRCVTAEDYISIIKSYHPTIESVTCWGGEQNNPPEYGRVFLSLKPKDGDFVSEEEKQKIINDTLKKRSVLTVKPFILNPDYTNLGLRIQCQYDPFATTKSVNELTIQIRNTIQYYNDLFLSSFGNIFRYSHLLTLIDKSDPAILNTAMSVLMFKKANFFGLNTSRNTTVELPELTFPISPYKYFFDNTRYLDTSPIYLNQTRHILKDYQDPTSIGKRKLKLVYYSTTGGTAGEKERVIDAGYIDLVRNTVKIKGFRPDTASSNVKIFMKPGKFDIAASKTQLLKIDPDEVFIDLVVDPISKGSSSSIENYNSQEYRYL